MSNISRITLSVMNRVDPLDKIKNIILGDGEFYQGNFSNYMCLLDNVIIRYNAEYASVHLSKLSKCTEEELLKIKEKYLYEMINKINAETICVRVDLDNGFTNHEFFKSNTYNPPEKNWIVRLMDKIGLSD